MVKHAGGPRNKDKILIPGQMYHLDLAFVSGPSNLKEMIEKGAKQKDTIIVSREGYIGFLTIIDVATRYLWVFPIKNKDPPIKLLNTFLTKRGIKKIKDKTITTSKNGYLAKSKAFKKNAKENGYTVKAKEYNYLIDTPSEDIECVIHTDGGGEFTAKHMIETIEDHGYEH